MILKDQIITDMTAAMKTSDKARTSTMHPSTDHARCGTLANSVASCSFAAPPNRRQNTVKINERY